jgi:hypothetical protein
MLVRFRTRKESGSALAAGAAAIHYRLNIFMLPVRQFLTALNVLRLFPPAGATGGLPFNGATAHRTFCTFLLHPLFLHPAAAGVCGSALGGTAADVTIARAFAGNCMGKGR